MSTLFQRFINWIKSLMNIAVLCRRRRNGFGFYAPVATRLVWIDAAPTVTSLGGTAYSRAILVDQNDRAMADQSGVGYTSGTPANATMGASSGLVTAVANGTSLLTAACSGFASITQTATVSQTVSSATISPASPTVTGGATQQFTLVAKDAGGTAISSPPAPTWYSNSDLDGSVWGSITSGGLLTAPTTGSGYIHAVYTNGVQSQYASVTVTQTLNHLTLTISSSDVAETDTAPTLTLGAWQSSDESTAYTDTLSPAASYSSDNGAVATINATTGVITLQGPGTVNLGVSAGGKSASIALTVTSSAQTLDHILPHLTPGTITTAGPAPVFSFSGYQTADSSTPYTDAYSPAPVYSSTDHAVALIDAATGVITLVGAGTTTVGVTVAGGALFAGALLTVTAAPSNAPVLNSISPTSLVQGATSDLVLTGSKFDSGCSVVIGGSGVTLNTRTAVAASTTGPVDNASNSYSTPRDFSSSNWSSDGLCTITPNAAAGPSGVAGGAQKMGETAGAGYAYLYYAPSHMTTTVGQVVYAEYYVKAAERTWIEIHGAPYGGGSLKSGYFVNLATGAIGSAIGTAGSSVVTTTDMGGGWWKVRIAYTAQATTASIVFSLASSDGVTGYTTVAGSGILLGGAQSEIVATPTFEMFTRVAATPARPSIDSATQITANVTVASGATTGSHPVTVHSTTNGDSASVGLGVTASGGGVQTLDHITLSASADTVPVNGTPPVMTLHAWQTSDASTPYTDALSPAPSWNCGQQSILTIDIGNGTITLEGGTGYATVNVSAGGKTTFYTLAVTAAVSYAWASAGPRSEASYSDWPTNAYADATAFQAAGGSNQFSFDTTNKIDGKPALLHTVVAASPSSPSRVIGPFTPAADQTVHFRTNFAKPASAYGPYDPAQPIMAKYDTRPPGAQSAFTVALFALGFDGATYRAPSWVYDTIGGDFAKRPTSGIVIQQTQGSGGVRYLLAASLFSTGGTLLSTTTFYTPLNFIGDEWYDPSVVADFFIRTYRSGANNSTLNIEVYAGRSGSAPALVGTASISMLDTSQAFPLPLRAMWDFGWQSDNFTSFGTDWNTRYGWSQVIDNAARPNLALDFAGTTALNTNGLGRYGLYGAPAIIPLDTFADTTELVAQRDVHCSLRSDTRVENAATQLPTLLAADAAHESHKSMRMTQLQYGYAASTGVQLDGNHSWAREIAEFWSGESLFFCDQWTTFGAGTPLLGTTLNQAVTGASSPQTVNVVDASKFGSYLDSGSCGFKTANYEAINFTSWSSSANTITGIFLNNHENGEDIRLAAGAGYKLLAASINVLTGNSSRLEIVGHNFQTYFAGVAIDTAQPYYANQIVGSIATSLLATEHVPITGSATDVVTSPVGNSQLYTPNGSRPGQQKPLRMYCHGTLFVDDYGKTRVRFEQYWANPAGTDLAYTYVECALLDSVLPSGPTLWSEIHFGENFNETLLADQTLDRYGVPLPGSLLGGGFSQGQVVVNPRDPAIGADPFGIMALFGVSTIAAPTLGNTKNISTTALTFPITAPGTGMVPTKVLVDRFVSGAWVAGTAIAFTAGLGGEQDVVVSGLTPATNYAGLLRVRLIGVFGAGAATLVAAGTTASTGAPGAPGAPANIVYRSGMTSSLVYGVTAAPTGDVPTTVTASVDESGTGSWVAQSPIAWTAGAGGTQDMTVTGLTPAKDYTGKIRFVLANGVGASSAVVVTSGTTAAVAYSLSVSPSSISGAAGGTVQLVVTENGVDVTSDAGTLYSTDDASVATVESSATTLVDVGFSFYQTGGGTPTMPAGVTPVADPSSIADPFTTDQASTNTAVKWQLYGFDSTDHARLRNSSLGVVSGLEFQTNNGTQATFLVKGLPAGTYSIYLAAGDDFNARTNYINVMDGATAKLTLAGAASTAYHFIDATGVSVVDTNPAGTAVFGTPLTGVALSGGNVSVLIGSPTSQSDQSCLSYIRFLQTA